MKRPTPFALAGLRGAAAACALLAAGCQTQTVLLSPPMHTRIVDGTTKLPLDAVRVTLVSRDTPQVATAWSDRAGYVDLPSLAGQDDSVLRQMTDTPHTAVHAVFQRPGYVTYTIDSVNGYGFFKGYYDVHLYPY